LDNKHDRDQAEGDVIDILRRNDAQNFKLSIGCAGGLWTVTVIDLDAQPGANETVGSGRTFTQAWMNQKPSWA